MKMDACLPLNWRLRSSNHTSIICTSGLLNDMAGRKPRFREPIDTIPFCPRGTQGNTVQEVRGGTTKN